jgi:predicted ATP-dependent serine protease
VLRHRVLLPGSWICRQPGARKLIARDRDTLADVELVEREPYLDRLEECLEQARGGSGRLVLLGGEAGAGKTSLARRFVEGRADRVRVLWGACDPLSTPRALAPF